MKRPNITPGPWNDSGYEDKTQRIIIESEEHQIASVFMPSDYVRRNSNAKAIAAVPRLLEALEFYANPENWKEQETGIGMYDGDAIDYGSSARKALLAAGYTE